MVEYEGEGNNLLNKSLPSAPSRSSRDGNRSENPTSRQDLFSGHSRQSTSSVADTRQTYRTSQSRATSSHR